MGEVRREEYPPRYVKLGCGCECVVQHQRGDRIHVCDHSRQWVITAIPPEDVQYTFVEVDYGTNRVVEEVVNDDFF